jgi:hypothetical protein
MTLSSTPHLQQQLAAQTVQKSGSSGGLSAALLSGCPCCPQQGEQREWSLAVRRMPPGRYYRRFAGACLSLGAAKKLTTQSLGVVILGCERQNQAKNEVLNDLSALFSTKP